MRKSIQVRSRAFTTSTIFVTIFSEVIVIAMLINLMETFSRTNAEHLIDFRTIKVGIHQVKILSCLLNSRSCRLCSRIQSYSFSMGRLKNDTAEMKGFIYRVWYIRIL